MKLWLGKLDHGRAPQYRQLTANTAVSLQQCAAVEIVLLCAHRCPACVSDTANELVFVEYHSNR